MEKTTLVLGASAKPERFSYDAIRSLQRYNIPVIPIGRKDADLGDIKITKVLPEGISEVHTVTLYHVCRKSERVLQFHFLPETKKDYF